MPERDRAAIGVDPFLVEPQLADHRHHLCGKGLVELDDLDVGERETGLLQGPGDGADGAHAHDLGRHADRREAHQPAQRLQAQLGRPLATHDHQRGGAVAHLRAVAGGDGTVEREGGPQPGERRCVAIAADPLVDIEGPSRDAGPPIGERRVDGLDRHDLVGEAAGILGRCRALMRAQRPGVLVVAADAVAAGDLLGGQAHIHEHLWPLSGDRGPRCEVEADHGHETHRLHARGDDHVGDARRDRLRRQGQRLQPGGAEAVDGHGA